MLSGDSDPTARKMALMSVPADRLLPPEVTMVRLLLFPLCYEVGLCAFLTIFVINTTKTSVGFTENAE